MNNISTSFTWKYIVEGMQQGDNTAFDAFYNLTYSKLKKRILFKTGFNEQDAEDLLQEAYIRVFSRINDLKDPEAVIGWTNTICDSIYLDHVKKENRRAGIANVVNESAMQSQDNDTDDFSLAKIADPDADIEALIEQQEVQNILREIISSLPDMYRSCIELQMSDKSVKEIAQELQLNENTAKTLIRRAKMQIKDKVLDLEKRGTKLYGVAPLVFFVWVYRIWMAKSEYLPTGSDAALSDLASASATAKDIANINSFSNNDKGLTNGKPNFSKGLYAQRHTDLEFGTNAEYRADISDITEELKIHDQPQGITEKLNRGRKSANVTNTAPNTDGTATAAAARGAISAAGTAGLGLGKIIAIIAAGVITTAAIAIGTVVAINNREVAPKEEITDDIVNNNVSYSEDTDNISPATTELTAISEERTESVIYEVSANYLGTWGSYETLGENATPDIIVIHSINGGTINFSAHINNIYQSFGTSAVMQEDGKALFRTDGEDYGYLTMNDQNFLIFSLEDHEEVFSLKDTSDVNPICVSNTAIGVFYSLNSEMYYSIQNGSNYEVNYNIDENQFVESTRYYKYKYDKSGKVIETESDSTSIIYGYDENERLIYRVGIPKNYSKDGAIAHKYSGGDTSSLYKISQSDADSLWAGYYFPGGIRYYEYDDAGKIISTFKSVEAAGVGTRTYTVFEYDDQERVISQIEYGISPDSSVPDYDSDPLSIKTYTWENDGTCIINSTNKFQEGGHLAPIQTKESETVYKPNEYIIKYGIPVSQKNPCSATLGGTFTF